MMANAQSPELRALSSAVRSVEDRRLAGYLLSAGAG
jgi:hypothetical protein